MTELRITIIEQARLSGMAWGRRFGVSFVLFTIVVGSSSSSAQIELSPERSAAATRARQTPKLDGTLDDPIWQTAPVVADFRQREPLETLPATEKTEVRILYDAHHVYFGFTVMTRLLQRS